MNRVILSGRLTKDPVVRTTQNGKNMADFTLAVNRNFADANGNRQTDFLPCVCFGKTADVVKKYAEKGHKLTVEGSIQTRSYDAQDGSKRYVTEILIDRVEFSGAPRNGSIDPQATTTTPEEKEQGYTSVDDDQLPF